MSAAKLDEVPEVPIENLTRGPRVRARTISMKRTSKRDMERGRLMYPTPAWAERPEQRADCEVCPTCQAWRDTSEHEPARGVRLACGHSTVEAVAHSRPCLYVACKFALYIDASEKTGAVKLNHPDKEPGDLAESCVLDVTDRGTLTLEEVGAALNITRERTRQLETRGLEKMKAADVTAALRDHLDEREDSGAPAGGGPPLLRGHHQVPAYADPAPIPQGRNLSPTQVLLLALIEAHPGSTRAALVHMLKPLRPAAHYAWVFAQLTAWCLTGKIHRTGRVTPHRQYYLGPKPATVAAEPDEQNEGDDE